MVRTMQGLTAVVLTWGMVWTACSTPSPHVKTDELGKDQHLAAARGHDAKAAEHRAEYDPTAVTPRGGPVTDVSLGANPTAPELAAAQVHERHATQHRSAAAALQTFEDKHCAGVLPAARAACPFLAAQVSSTQDLPTGVRLMMINPANTDALVALLQCHAAFANTHHLDTVQDCPPYVPQALVQRSADGRGVEILTRQAADVEPLQKLAAAQVGLPAMP